jgi:AraC-like DNA-binding protein
MALSIMAVRGLLEALEHHGIDRRAFFEAAGFDDRRIDDPESRVTLEECDRLHELALDMTGDAAFGLHQGERASAVTYNLVGHLAEHAGTLRQAIEALIRFQKLFADRTVWKLVENDATAMLLYDVAPGSARCRRLRTEGTLTGFYRMVRYFARDARPKACFEYRAPPYVAEYQRIFEGTARFEQPFSGIVIDRALLEARTVNHDAEFHALLQKQAEKRASRIAQTQTYSERVREVLLQGAASRSADMNAVARVLGLSARSLRRRLSEEGASFAQVLQGALATQARALLADEARSIEDTAYAMGFSEPSAFHRAFKRWTGLTPKAYRGSRLSAPQEIRE